MSCTQFHCIKMFILRHAWLNLWDKHMTTGRINQVTIIKWRDNLSLTTQRTTQAEWTVLRASRFDQGEILFTHVDRPEGLSVWAVSDINHYGGFVIEFTAAPTESSSLFRNQNSVVERRDRMLRLSSPTVINSSSHHTHSQVKCDC
jgi:hypothetical protein